MLTPDILAKFTAGEMNFALTPAYVKPLFDHVSKVEDAADREALMLRLESFCHLMGSKWCDGTTTWIDAFNAASGSNE